MIRPVSLAQNNTSFGIKKVEGVGSYNKESDSRIEENKNEKDFKSGFYLGMICSAMLGATGVSIYKDNQINNLLQEIAKQSAYSDFKSIEVEDRTEDSVPELILTDKNGDKTVYDITSGQVYFDEDGELIKRH